MQNFGEQKGGKFYTKRQSGGKTPQIRTSPNPNRSESQRSCIFQEPVNMGKYAYMGIGSNMPWEKVPAFLRSHPCATKPENNRLCVPLHLATNRFTFEKFLPPPPLLHPVIIIRTKERLLGIQRVSNSSTENQRISTPALSNGRK